MSGRGAPRSPSGWPWSSRPAGPLLWVLFDGITTGNSTLLADRDPGNGRNAEAPDRPGRPRPLRPAPARRSAAVAGDGRRPRRRRPRLRLPAPPLGARHRRRRPRPRRLRAARPRRPGDHRPLHDARRRRCWRSSSPSRLLGWRLLEPGHPWRRPLAGSSPALVALMFVVWLPNQWDLDSTGRHRPHQPGPDRERPHRPRRRRRLRAALRADRRPQPPRRPPPRLRPRSASRPRSSAPARQRQSPTRGYFVDPASPFVIHNFILDPNDPTRFISNGPAGLHRGRRATSPGRLPPLLSRRRPRSTRSIAAWVCGGEVGVGEVDPRRQLDVEVVGGVEPGAQAAASASRGRGRRGCGRR